jgi:hypothetical protein
MTDNTIATRTIDPIKVFSVKTFPPGYRYHSITLKHVVVMLNRVISPLNNYRNKILVSDWLISKISSVKRKITLV